MVTHHSPNIRLTLLTIHTILIKILYYQTSDLSHIVYAHIIHTIIFEHFYV